MHPRNDIDIRETLGIWPVVFVRRRRPMWSLWFAGAEVPLLERQGRAVFFSDPSLLAAAVLTGTVNAPASVDPIRADEALLDRLLASPPFRVDPSAVRRWFRDPSWGDTAAMAVALDGMNLLADVATTARDEELLDLLASEPMCSVLDALTIRLTFLAETPEGRGASVLAPIPEVLVDPAAATRAVDLFIRRAVRDCVFDERPS